MNRANESILLNVMKFCGARKSKAKNQGKENNLPTAASAFESLNSSKISNIEKFCAGKNSKRSLDLNHQGSQIQCNKRFLSQSCFNLSSTSAIESSHFHTKTAEERLISFMKSRKCHQASSPKISVPNHRKENFIRASALGSVKNYRSSHKAVKERNEDLQQFVVPVKEYLKNNAITLDEEKIMLALCHSFDCGNRRIIDCIENFATMTGLKSEKVKELICQLDPAGSSTAVKSYIESLNNETKKWKFYAGATTTTFENRKRDHNKVHLNLHGQKILSVKSFALGSFAETAAICTIQNLVGRKIIGGHWNKSYGYDSPSMMKAGIDATTTNIYVIHTPRPFEKPKTVKGSLRLKSTVDVRMPGKFFCIHSNTLLGYRGLDSHMELLGRINYPCGDCNAVFSSKWNLDRHSFNYHVSVKTNSKCNYSSCNYESTYNGILQHIHDVHHIEV